MCTAVSFSSSNYFFGRNLDYHFSFGERVLITPRNYILRFKKMPQINSHYAFIGIGITENGYPLYFDMINEKGVGFAGLNFPDNAKYFDCKKSCVNLAPYELSLWLLAKCKNIKEVRNELSDINIINEPFNSEYSISPLHFIFSDKDESIVVESTENGINIYDNPVGVLTNNPTFPMQILNLNNYLKLSPDKPENNFGLSFEPNLYSNGMGALGMPGDLSSMSRFIRASFVKQNLTCETDINNSLTQFFHILYSVYQQKGCVKVSSSEYEYTQYSSCYDLKSGICYYTTYDNKRITQIDIFNENLDDDFIKCYNLNKTQDILCGN